MFDNATLAAHQIYTQACNLAGNLVKRTPPLNRPVKRSLHF